MTYLSCCVLVCVADLLFGDVWVLIVLRILVLCICIVLPGSWFSLLLLVCVWFACFCFLFWLCLSFACAFRVATLLVRMC